MIEIAMPHGCRVERAYIAEVVFKEWFGLEFYISQSDDPSICIRLDGHEGAIHLPDTFFGQFSADIEWLDPSTLPKCPLCCWNPAEYSDIEFGSNKPLPLVFGETDFCKVESEISPKEELPIDIFGSLFFLISRYEEAVSPIRDSHDRFPASASVLGKENLLHRAIGNEYLEVLWAAMKNLWPELQRKTRAFRVVATQDVDHPSFFWEASLLRRCKQAALTAARGAPFRACQQLSQSLAYPRAGWSADPYETMDTFMDISEAAGVAITFFYIPESTHRRFDPGMPIKHPQVEGQWQRIHKRGHAIGVHPGYDSFSQPARISGGVELVRHQLDKLSIDQARLCSRQHYLRWKTPETARALDRANIDEDSSLGFADYPGFRCGVCYDFPMYDVIERQALKLRQRPLIAMDTTVIAEAYLGLGSGDEAHARFKSLKNTCRRFRGDFVVLWHNTNFIKPSEVALYRAILN